MEKFEGFLKNLLAFLSNITLFQNGSVGEFSLTIRTHLFRENSKRACKILQHGGYRICGADTDSQAFPTSS